MRIELNLTLRCNASCANCNRCCDLFPDRTDDIRPSRLITELAAGCAARRPLDRVKVAGGEPLLHPNINRVVRFLDHYVRDGHARKVKIDTNGVIPVPDGLRMPNISWSGTNLSKKRHLPYLWSPTDLGLPITPCSQPRVCGLSLDNEGWLPCSPAIMIVRSFRLEHLYRYEMPTEPWGLDEICKHCIHAAPAAFRKEHAKRLCDITDEEKTPTPSWEAALERYRRVYIDATPQENY